MGTKEHRHTAPESVRVGVLTASTTRGPEDDTSGHWMCKRALKEGHDVVAHRVVPDDAESIAEALLEMLRDQVPDVVLVNGGTGISPADVTIEALRPLFSKELSAFSVMFTQLSVEQIDSAAILSRATAGVVGNSVVFCMPGSLKACKLACKAIIFPEITHIVKHLGE